MLPPSRSSRLNATHATYILPRRDAIALLAAAALVLVSAGARAQSRPLDAPRAAGTVGERYDGFAVVRGTATPDISALVDRVNAERRAVYEQNASSQKASVEAIGRIYAQEILKSAPSKTWFLSEAGQWSQK